MQPGTANLLFAAVVLASAGALASATAQGSALTVRTERATNNRPVRVFIIAGQSNAEGHNHIHQYHGGGEPFPTTFRDQPRILYWPGNKTVQTNENLWTTLRVEASGTFGPEIAFGHDLAQALPDETVAIIKYAAGGTGIARSTEYTDYIPAVAGYDDRGRNWHPPTDHKAAGALYKTLMDNIHYATSTLERKGQRWELSGFLWMQGEHEASISRKMAEDYERLLSDFIRSLRKDLRSPSLQVLIGQVNNHSWAYGDIARKAQVEVCRKIENTRLVQTIDLPRVDGDAAHFTADGMLTLGSRFAEAIQFKATPRRM